MSNYIDPIDLKKSVGVIRDLAPHQKLAVEALDNYFKTQGIVGEQNGLLVMPTGSGKTFTSIYWLISSFVSKGFQVVWLVHRQELIDQATIEFENQAPRLLEYGIGKVKIVPVSGLHMKMSMVSKSEINILSIASAANKYGYRFIKRLLGTKGQQKLVVVVDEAHHAISPSYEKVLKRITTINPNRILIGLTATPTRMQERDRGKLFKQFNVIQNIKNGKGTEKGFVYEVTMKELLIAGFLAKPIYYKIETKINGDSEYELTEEDEKYFSKFGEFSEEMKSKIAGSAARNKLILDEYLNNKDKYGKTLIFAINQEHAKQLSKAFNDAGIPSNYVVANQSGNAEIIGDFKKGKLKVLINVQILTEGSDVPDIQTVFLTRQTNSDSLLMQMIGRGLRGVSAGGTKEAYIVDFHDTWDKISFWLEPKTLQVFVDPDDPENQDTISELVTPVDVTIIDGNEDNIELPLPLDVPEILGREPDFTLWDLYLRVYQNMRSNLLTGVPAAVFPNGWYSVLDTEGNDKKVLVYDSQASYYKNFEKNIDQIIAGKMSVNQIIAKYFCVPDAIPEYNDIAILHEFVKESGEMPEYYTFEQRDQIDVKRLANEMNNRFSKEEDKEMWLHKLFSESPMIREFFKYFYVFKKAVLSAHDKKQEAIIEQIDERAEYHLVADKYNLNAILDEIVAEYQFMNKVNLTSISWTNECVKRFFGMCYRWQDNTGEMVYSIEINRLLSSDDVSRDVIKYLIYHEMLHKSGYWDHDAKFRELEWQFPESDELDGFLDELYLKYNMDFVWRTRNKKSDLFSNAIDMSENSNTLQAKQEQKSNFKFCRSCGNKLPTDAKFCDKCGSNTDYENLTDQ